jgi:hypothetical protein
MHLFMNSVFWAAEMSFFIFALSFAKCVVHHFHTLVCVVQPTWSSGYTTHTAPQHLKLASDRMKARRGQLVNSAEFQEDKPV